MRKFVKNPKKGVVIELAVLVIFITAALSGLIVSLSTMGMARTKADLKQISERAEIDMVAESYLTYLIDGNEDSFNSDDYGIEKLDLGTGTITILVKSGEKVKLTIELKENDVGAEYKYTVLKWKY